MKLPESHQLRRALLSIQVLDHPIRRQIMELLMENKKMNVRDIQKNLRIEQSPTSQHLALLRRAGYLSTDRRGKEIYYSLVISHLNSNIMHIMALSKSDPIDNNSITKKG